MSGTLLKQEVIFSLYMCLDNCLSYTSFTVTSSVCEKAAFRGPSQVVTWCILSFIGWLLHKIT